MNIYFWSHDKRYILYLVLLHVNGDIPFTDSCRGHTTVKICTISQYMAYSFKFVSQPYIGTMCVILEMSLVQL